MMTDLSAPLEYRHVDVCSDVPCAGNGLIVAFGPRGARAGAFVSLTAELRQLEARWRTSPTGSAAGPAAASLAAHGLAAESESIIINQGWFLGQPSRIAVTPDSHGELWVGGPVAPVPRGLVDGRPHNDRA